MTAQMAATEASAGDRVLQQAAERARKYVAGVNERRASPTEQDLLNLARFDEPFPDGPCDPAEVLRMLDEVGSPATMSSTGGRYFGFVNGGALPVALAANWLAGAWDQNSSFRAMSPVAAELEEVVLRWITDALRLPKDCEGGLVTCATAASFTALVAARHALLARAGWNADEDGLFDAPPIDVVVGEEVHASISKALRLAGFGKKHFKRVEVDGQGRMRADKLPRLSDRTIVCVQAGNVNTGAFDPAGEICARAREQNAWVHVDGAFGLWAAASPKFRHLTEGFDQADSWATDAHKWPNVPYDSGIVLVKDGMALRSTMAMTAAYLQSGARREPMNHTPDSSRRARGVDLWAGLKSLGRQGLAALIERTCAHAQRFAAGFREAGFEVLNDVVINQVLVAFGSPEVTQKTIRAIQEDGTCWCGGTVWKGRTAMRLSVSSWATTEADVTQCLDAITRIARSCQEHA